MIYRLLNWLVTRFVDCPDPGSLDTSFHRRRVEQRMKDPEFRAAYHDCNCGNPSQAEYEQTAQSYARGYMDGFDQGRRIEHECNCGNPEPHTDHEGDTV